jgi:hypothetical protein
MVKRTARTKLYVGINGRKRQVFRSARTPTESSHGDRFKAVIGPFRTVGAAKIMAEYGANNPHLQTVADAEKIAKSRRS